MKNPFIDIDKKYLSLKNSQVANGYRGINQ